MIVAACIIGAAVILAAVIVCNTIENVAADIAEDFFARWDALDEDDLK